LKNQDEGWTLFSENASPRLNPMAAGKEKPAKKLFFSYANISISCG
jgi:hypothetical protein